MSKIEWTTKTWNPVVGCSIVSPGCTNCYAMKMAARIERMSPESRHYAGLTQPSKSGSVWTGKVALAPEHILDEPSRRKKPTTWFVNVGKARAGRLLDGREWSEMPGGGA